MTAHKTTCLITGAAGFIGHHLVQYLLEKTDWNLIMLDRLDSSGSLNRIHDLPGYEQHKKRMRFEWHDLKAPVSEFLAARLCSPDYIIHLAASSHVDRSIEDPLLFAMDNVVGTVNILNFARTIPTLKKFINFSTDEVFGPAPEGYAHKENESHKPSNPYSASKSAQEAFGYAFYITYGLPIITTHTMNNFGERQHPEKLIPKTIRSVINGTPMPLFAEVGTDGKLGAVGSRFWIHCRNTASAILFLLSHGVAGESYNIIGFDELTNLEIAEKVASIIGKPLIPQFVDFTKVRPGHDRRYALDGSKLRDLGWKPEVSFDESLRQTVEFTLAHPEWQ
jgi:dTDP-glucose 4,6-dehydratase